MTTLYPWGYRMRMVDIDELKRLARFDLCEPEAAERFEHWIVSRGGQIGIGGAVRFVQPDLPGFAPAGSSFHELQEWFDGLRAFAALDLVCPNGENVHRAPRWDEVPKQGSGHPDISNYGVHCNVSGEPWHMQPIEIDGHATWVRNGRRRPNPDFPILKVKPPEPTPEPPPPAPEPPPPAPAPTGPFAPGERTLRVSQPQMEGIDVAFVQGVVRDKAGQDYVTVDGFYGPDTARGVENVQNWFKATEPGTWGHLAVDGVVGPQTWPLIIKLSQPAPSGVPYYEVGSRTLRLASPTMLGTDIVWVQNVLRNQGLAVSIDGYYGRQTADRVKVLQGWNNLDQDGVVGPQTFSVLKQY